jgi:hypothetical protein
LMTSLNPIPIGERVQTYHNMYCSSYF